MSDVIERYRDPRLFESLVRRIGRHSPGRPLTLMHVCGTHENAVARFGIRNLLPDWLRIIAGPGCPVCVCPPADIHAAVQLALDHDAVIATFGDMVNVPADDVSLADARADGGDVRVVYSAADAATIAREEKDMQVVFFAVGFETTACTSAAVALTQPPENFSMLVSHRLIPPALDALMRIDGLSIDGFLLPGHVLAVTGTGSYLEFCEHNSTAAVVAGFEAVDIMLGISSLVDMIIRGESDVQNAYPRAVRSDGNERALQATNQAFDAVDSAWRGLGVIPASGLALRKDLSHMDAMGRFDIRTDKVIADDPPGCECSSVMTGIKDAESCALFGRACRPDSPKGPCMVSSEGTCRNRYLFKEPEYEE